MDLTDALAAAAEPLKEWVRDGGVLYATDWASEWVEAFNGNVAVSAPSKRPAYSDASAWIVTEPKAPSGDATNRRAPRFSAAENPVCS